MGTKNDNLLPYMAVHPGGILKEELSARGLKQNEFAKQIGLQPSHLNELIRGKRSFNSELSYKLEKALHIPSQSWMGLQAQYDHQKILIAQKGNTEVSAKEKLEEYNKFISVNDIVKRLGLNCTNSEILTVISNIMELDDSEVDYAFFRKSFKTGLDERMIRTWLLLAKYNAHQQKTDKKFRAHNKEKLICELRQIFNENNNTIERTEKTLSKHGIRFGIEPKLEKASIDGCSFTMDKEPCIILTNRFNRIDTFAFNVMHELGHIYNHLEDKKVIISISSFDGKTNKEKVADDFANTALIPKEIWDNAPTYNNRLNKYTFQKYYTQWANDIGYNKWLILGRISHELGLYNLRDDGSRCIR